MIGREFDAVEAEVRVVSEAGAYESVLEDVRTFDRYLKDYQSPATRRVFLNRRTVCAVSLFDMEEKMSRRMQRIRELRGECK